MKYRYRTDEEMKDSGVEWLGKIPKEWDTCKIGMIATVKSSRRIYEDDYKDEGIPFYRSKEIVNLSNGLDCVETEIFISDELYREHERKYSVPKKGDLLITSIGTIGRTWISDGRSFYYKDGNITQIDNNEHINIRFLKYCFESSFLKEQYNMNSDGSTIMALTIDKIKNLKVLNFNLRQQGKIVDFLDEKTSQFNSIISKKEALIEKLEEAKKSFISEVVTGKVKVVKTEEGYDVVQRKPEEMKESITRLHEKICSDFKVISVKNLLRKGDLEIQDGNHGELHPTSKDYMDEGVPFVMASDIKNNTVDLEACKYISFDRSKKLRIGFSKEGDVLLTHKGTIGEVAIVTETNGYPYIVLTPQVTYYRLEDKADIYNLYLAYLLRSDFVQRQLKVISEMQSTRAYIGIVAQRDLSFIVPKLDEQRMIVKYLNYQVNKFNNLITHNKNQIQKLKEAKQSLITEAVTGKIEILD